MSKKSIAAYDLPDRVRYYDEHMDIMHPNRPKMIDVVLRFLPFEQSASFTALELGTGTGYFTQKLIEKYPSAKIISIDGAASMIDLAKTRLGEISANIDFRVGDFRNLDSILDASEKGDIVFSSYALHHLNTSDKTALVKRAVEFLRPGGWFVNADNIIAETEEVEKMYQRLRVEGILERANGAYDEYKDFTTTRKFLDDLEANEQDQPLTLREDLDILKNANLKNVSPLWLEYREAVTAGQK